MITIKTNKQTEIPLPINIVTDLLVFNDYVWTKIYFLFSIGHGCNAHKQVMQ